MNDRDLLLAIAARLSAREWDADTCEEIAALLRADGFVVFDVGVSQTFDGWRAFEYFMYALDGVGCSYVVERVKLASGVVLRANVGPGFDVHQHNSGGLVLSCSEAPNAKQFKLPPNRIASVTVLPL